MNDWISVDERLPLEELYEWRLHSSLDFEVIVKIKEAIFPTTLYFDCNGFYDENSEYYNVTHWMPIPDFSEGSTVISEEKRETKVKINPTLEKQTLTTPTVRPCIINGKKGFFYMWSEVINGEQLKTPVGVVELECGICLCVPPGEIKFTDRKENN